MNTPRSLENALSSPEEISCILSFYIRELGEDLRGSESTSSIKKLNGATISEVLRYINKAAYKSIIENNHDRIMFVTKKIDDLQLAFPSAGSVQKYKEVINKLFLYYRGPMISKSGKVTTKASRIADKAMRSL